MSQGFLIWTDFHPILVGAGCLALGYVYGRHCRSISEIPADVPPASDEVCCAQSQSNTYFEDLDRPCKCCVSAPAQLDCNEKKTSKFTRSPYLVQNAAEGFEQAERSTKRGLANRMQEKLEYADTESQGMRQLSCGPYFEKGYQVLEEERYLQAKTPYKKQKGSKGKAEMGFDPLSSERVKAEDDSTAPWSREVLHKRIDYFNNVSESSVETGRTEESRKLRLIKQKFLKVSSQEEPPAYSSTSVTPAAGGLAQLATLPQPGDNQSPSSPYRISGGGCHIAATAAVLQTSVSPVLQSTIGNTRPTANGLETNCKDADADTSQQRSCDPREKQGNEAEAVSFGVAVGSQVLHSIQAELLPIPSATSRAPVHHVADRCELREESSGDEVLKAEICKLLNETDCNKVPFEEIVSLLERRLQTNLQERKAVIADLVREIASVGELLETERATTEEKNPASAV